MADDTNTAEREAFSCCNTWFESLPEGRKAVLRDDKWMLAHAAFEAGRASLAASAGSEPVAWPKNAAEVREFFNSDFISAKFAAPDGSPCDEDRYYISAHDFLSAINWWADFPHHPSPPEGMAGWRPIETAPKDGGEILLRSARGRIADGAWGQPDGWANPNCWVWPYINQEPTHWMPLPKAPAPPASEAKEL